MVPCCEVKCGVDSDSLDPVKQSAALCLLRLIRNAPDSVSMSEWSSRVIHLLNDQHMVCTRDITLLSYCTVLERTAISPDNSGII